MTYSVDNHPSHLFPRTACLLAAAFLIVQLVPASIAHGQAGPVTEPGRIEAENASDFMGTVETAYAGFSGTGYVRSASSRNAYIEWILDLPAGDYYAHFRYANGSSANRRAILLLNGDVIVNPLAFSSTGAWTNWALSAVTAFTPTDGTTNTLRLKADTTSGLANIDYVEISTNSEIAYRLTVVNGSGGGVYPVDTVVPIVADTQALPFLRWTGDVANVENTRASSTTIRMAALTGDATVTATFGELKYGTWMAESTMQRYPNVFNEGSDSWEYQKATVLRGFEELWYETGNPDFFNYIKDTIDGVVSASGSISGYNGSIYSLDEVKEIDLCLFLYRQTGAGRYRLAAYPIRDQLTDQPRTYSAGFWHRGQQYPFQMWLDGLYMAEPFYCEYGEMFNQPENFSDVALQFKQMYNHSVDTETGLLYHAWDESKAASWADPETGHSPVFWSRSMGWYMMALVDVLDHFPTDHPERGDLIQILRGVSAGLLAVRDPESGVWWQVPDHPNEGANYKESSGGLMYTYAFSKGARLGYLDASYRAVAEQSFWDHVAEFTYETTNGRLSLTNTCQGTSVGGSLDYYYNRAYSTNDTKGIGPFMMAAAEIEFRRMQPLYTLTVAGGRGGGKYLEGRNIRIAVGTAPEGAVFLRWAGDTDVLADRFSPTTSLVMPARDLSIRAVFFRPDQPTAVSPSVWPAYDAR